MIDFPTPLTNLFSNPPHTHHTGGEFKEWSEATTQRPTPSHTLCSAPTSNKHRQSLATHQQAFNHAKEVFAPTSKHPVVAALTPEQHNAAIKEAFLNDDTVPKDPILLNAQGKTPKLVRPSKDALLHLAATLIHHYSKHGCPVDCGDDWTHEHIEAAILRGAHPSADSELALKALHDETNEKIANGYSKVVRYGDIKDNLPKNLKISPVAMIPHKSRSFRTILDLSFRLKLKGKLMPSVNSGTTKQAPAESMIQLGMCIQRLVALLADNYDPQKPFKFAKLDIKDGFWRMAVNEEDAWNFCYVLPQEITPTNIDDTLIVVPDCLQMGWCESPPYFCASSETARDVIDSLITEATLPAHAFENKMMQEAEQDATQYRLSAAATYVNLTEVFVDDFIGATNNINTDHLRHFSRAMLYGVHSIFPPPEVTGHQGEDPISQKKLDQGEGTWRFSKEILGWLVDGANFTIQLMPDKCKKLVQLIRDVTKCRQVPLSIFQELAGKLQHASFAIPGGKGLFSIIHRAMAGLKPFIKITPDIKQTLNDWTTVVRHLASCPTPVRLLVSDFPNYIQYTDACKLGAGGVVVPGMDPFYYYVWQFEWPKDIRDELVSWTNPKGSLTINDLELAGLLLGWLVIEYICGDLRFKHIGSFCDNTSAVAWSLKGHTSTSIVAGRLLRFLALRQRIRQTSSLLPMNIAGKDNAMADIPSRAFKNGDYFHAQQHLTTYFNTHFPLPQKNSWIEYQLPTKITSRVISCLRGELTPMASLIRLPKLGKSIGATGRHTAHLAVSKAHTSKTSAKSSKESSSSRSLPVCGPGLSVSEIKSEFKPSRMHSRPSARPANWLANKVPLAKVRANTFFPSKE